MKTKMRLISALIILATITVGSCKSSSENKNENETKTSKYDYSGDKLVITDKIMYDVPIVNEIIGDRSKNNPDWFWENLPTPGADDFIKTLLSDAMSGKLKTYYYDMTGNYESFDVIKDADLKTYMEDVMSYEFELVDTTVKRYKTEKIAIHLDYRNVKKLRFLEEWFIAEGEFHKRVIAVAPYFVIEYPDMKTVNAVYFWILLDEPKKEN
jgi:hypothetical protein